MAKKEELTKIEEAIKACKLCPLAKGRTYAVPGAGNFDADIVFIGEGPGAKEDKVGEPFVGAAGKFLAEMLAEIKMKREDVFITNVVKCRPPNNRDPLPDEVQTCTTNYLWKQLELIDPKIIITLGRHAMYRFLPQDRRISQDHGKLFKLTSPKSGRHFDIFPLYHPAAALYNGGMREVLMEDFKKIPRVLKKLELKQNPL
ncbi:MAG: uracil-DNA glycosylase [Candidatus Pacebacteria bacterium]|nr:uracil-DNA glycosylase [Candidatus Paceibacterota bacterium]